MRLSASQLSEIDKAVDRACQVARSDGMIVGRYKLALEDLAETVLLQVMPEIPAELWPVAESK